MAASIVVLASGTGSLLQALLDSPLRDRIRAVGSDRHATGALERAQRARVPAFVVDPQAFEDRRAWAHALLVEVSTWQPSLVVCAGFMRILDEGFVATFPGRIINSHPSLLPAFPGAHAVRDALAYGVTITGCTVHVVDEGIDTGPIIAQCAVEVRPDDDVATLHERIKERERPLLVASVTALLTDLDAGNVGQRSAVGRVVERAGTPSERG